MNFRLPLIFLCLFLCFSSCNKKKADCGTNEYSYTFLPSSSVDTVRIDGTLYPIVNSGAKDVFKYQLDHPGCPDIADDEVVQILLFEVDPTVASFNYNAADFATNSCFFRKICFCFGETALQPVSGTISGTKTSSNTWQIAIDVLLPDNTRVQTTGTFTKE